MRTYPAAPKDVFFSAFKQKHLKAEFLTFLKIAIYCTRPCAIWIYVLKNRGHGARLGEKDHLFLWTGQLSQKTYQVPKVLTLVHALNTQEMMRRKDA